MQQAIEFFRDFNETIQRFNVELALITSFSGSPSSALKEIRDGDINIIMGFFGPQYARNVLCMVMFVTT